MKLLVFGAGYSGRAIARAAAGQGISVRLVSRQPKADEIAFTEAGAAIAESTHLVATAPPGENGDPVLAAHGEAIRRAPALLWAGYLSTTGVYGDRGGDSVDEDTPPAPGSDRSKRRLAAEESWRDAMAGRPLDLIRLAGIYGPGRSPLDDVRQGRARRVIKPGHVFGRIHRDDIAALVLAAIARPPSGTRILHGTDDLPAESAEVNAFAAALLGAPLPPAIAFADAAPAMSAMALSFWSEQRRVENARTKAALGLQWRYPTYKEGLVATLREEDGAPP